ncbi:MAG: voltage-gated sodium channel [Verrucomicrobiales bacterium]|jgi:voltage-gated sodium channel
MVETCRRLVDSKFFNRFIIGTIIVAGIVVGIETFPEIKHAYHGLWKVLDTLILAIFTIEIIIKMIALSPNPLRFFKDGWNVFDFIIVAVCFLPFGGGYAAVLRLFRLLRVLRLVTVVPKLQILVGAILRSLPSMFYVTLLLALLFYIYAVVGVMFFRGNDPIHFSDLWTSMLSLFRVVTLEDWTDIMYIQMYGSDAYAGYNQSVEGLTITPKAQPLLGAAYFISFVLIGTMVMLNLVIGVVISGMDNAQKEVAERQLHRLLEQDGDEAAADLNRKERIEVLRSKLQAIDDELERLV